MTSQSSVTNGRLAWSVSEISISTGLSVGFVRKEIRAGKLVARRAGRRVLVLDRDLQQYLSSGEPK
jgi:excisionase family DNA binding protein